MLSLSLIMEKLNNATSFTESSNYYFERHDCKSGDSKKITKVSMDFELKDEISGEALRFGICPGCGACYYHSYQ